MEPVVSGPHLNLELSDSQFRSLSTPLLSLLPKKDTFLAPVIQHCSFEFFYPLSYQIGPHHEMAFLFLSMHILSS